MIPVNIITGALGVGKTTALRHLLSQRPPNERWAIVVNEFGALGIDGAILDTAGGMTRRPGPRAGGGGDDGGASEPVAAAADDDDDDDGMVVVREVAGGCLCCAVAAPFTVAVTQVLRRARPDRLFIEPSGMGHPGGLFDALSNEHLRGVLALRATIALVDVREVATRGEVFRSDAFVDQVQCADVVVGAKADLASANDADDFREWARSLYPPKARVLVVEHGKLEMETLDVDVGVVMCPSADSEPREKSAHAAAARGIRTSSSAPPPTPPPPPTRGAPTRVRGGDDGHATCGWVFHRDDVFARPLLARLLTALANEPAVKRVKGVLRLGSEWVAPAVAVGGDGRTRVALEPAAYRRDSRIEIIATNVAARGEIIKEEGEDDRVVDGDVVDRAGEAARANDWDAVESAIVATLKPPK